MAVTILKQYRYKVYDSTGVTYQGDLSGVESDPSIPWDIASAGGQLVITLDKAADNFSEGTLIKFKNRVQVYCIDAEQPTGVLVFQGFISNWQPLYVPGGEKVQITLLSYGYELMQIVMQNFQAQTSWNSTQNIANGGTPDEIAQLIQLGPTTTSITGIDLIIDNASNALISVSFYAINNSTPNTPDSGSLLASNSFRPNAPLGLFHFDFSSAPATTTSGGKIWVVVGIGTNNCNVGYNNTNTYSIGKIATRASSVWTTDTTKALYFVLYPNLNQTDLTFTNIEVGTMMQLGLANYQLQGGTLSYDSSSVITTTAVTVASITFNAITIFDFLNKCVDLVPNSYWYVDQTQNKLYFQIKANTPTHKLTLGKDLKSVQLQKYMENVINTLLFTGGASGGVNLFREYVKQDSVNLYGVRTGTYSDSNITTANQATADQIATAFFQANAYPLVRSTIEVVDTAAGGYDIELFRPGDMLWIKGTKGSASSLWDVAQWDVDYWDFNLYDINSMILQITRVSYTPGIATLDISMVPPQVTKQTQALQTQVTQVTQVANPSTPTTIYL